MHISAEKRKSCHQIRRTSSDDRRQRCAFRIAFEVRAQRQTDGPRHGGVDKRSSADDSYLRPPTPSVRPERTLRRSQARTRYVCCPEVLILSECLAHLFTIRLLSLCQIRQLTRNLNSSNSAMFFAVILAVDHDVVSWRSWFNRLPFTLRYGESNSQLASFGVFPRREEVEELRQVMMGDEIDAEMYLVPQEMLDDFVNCFKQDTESDVQTQCMAERVDIVRENGHRIVTQLDVDEAQEDWYWWVPLF